MRTTPQNPRPRPRPWRRLAGRLALILTAGTCGLSGTAWTPAGALAADPPGMAATVVPAPAHVESSAATFTLGGQARIYVQDGSPEATKIGEYLRGLLRPATGYALPLATYSAGVSGGVSLLLSGADAALGDQGYRLEVTGTGVTLRANAPAGLFAGVQTLRQLLPAAIEHPTVRPGPWTVPGGIITDRPRFRYRGAMLDVARHFFGVDAVKRYIDELALYKINTLHLHLSDDQGWRVQIDSWPRLAEYGGSTQVGGGPGGYYTKAQYREIVAHAQSRHITIVPEIDLPGHTNAALASYAELNCDGTAPPLYTGTGVGFSSLCISKETTYRFVEDVIRELAELTPGPYLHIGGDEAHATTDADYATFMNRVLPIVAKYGKRAVGWNEVTKVGPPVSTVPQYWGTGTANTSLAQAVQRGNKVVMSPANKTYMDMKYNASTPIGLTWAGYIEVRTAYDWDPAAYVTGVPEAAVLGVEAPLWSETVRTLKDIEFMAFPRVAAVAEVGWSPQAARDWTGFRGRLAAQGPRWDILGVNYYASQQIPWPGRGNLAAFRPVTVSSTEVDRFGGANANDGDASTRWSSAYSDPQWIRIDLGSVQRIDRAVLRWETAYARAYQLQVSDDGAGWRDLYATTAGDGGVDELTGLNGTGRYLRVNTTVRATGWGVSLYEIEAYAPSP
ncbi:family 20 glycosylhydrolase [Streptosporangium sp. NPDC003464]